MKVSLFAIMCGTSVTVAAGTVDFTIGAVGKPPPGFTVAITGEGQPDWRIERDETAPGGPQVLQQSGNTPHASFPLCIKESPLLKDGWIQVKFKTVSGKIDQAAGLIWRVRDQDNYYVCRANALENNVVLYKVYQGKRSPLDIVGRAGGYGVETKVAPAVWHTLRVEFEGRTFKVLLDGQNLFEVVDDTFKNEGRIGLWTKADSVTFFDDFTWGPDRQGARVEEQAFRFADRSRHHSRQKKS